MADITPVVRATDAITISPGSGISITQSGSAGSYVYTIANTGGGGGAPTDAEYLVAAAHASLSAERITTDTATVSWDHGEAGKAKASVVDGSITYAKMQDVSAASKILGRGDSGAGDPQEITLGTNLSITGTTLNAAGGGVSDGDKGDITVSGGGATWTIDNTAVSNAKLRDSGAMSVIGRSANSTGAPADISTAADGDVLRRSGTTLGFGKIVEAGITAATITDASIAAANKDGVAGTASMRTLGTGSTQACAGNDARLSDSRAPNGSATGDLTGSYPGPTIAANAVTLAKMADIATDRLLGRDTAASGDPEELTVGGGIEFTGTGGIQRSALTGDVTATAGSASTTIANDAVTYAKMQNVSAASKILGRGSAGGSGDVEEITLGTNLSMSGTTLNAAAGGAGNTLYAPGNVTVATGNFQVHVKRLELTTTQRLALAGTARFRLMN